MGYGAVGFGSVFIEKRYSLFSDEIQGERQVRHRQRHRPVVIFRRRRHLLRRLSTQGQSRRQKASLQTTHQRPGVKVIKTFFIPLSWTVGQSKLECLSMASLFNLSCTYPLLG